MFYSEKEAEQFLEKRGFNIVKRVFVKDSSLLESTLNSFKFPVVMKVFGKKIVHKNKLGGIILNIMNLKQALNSFDKLKKISGFEGVVIQEQISGKEILIGINKTKDFGHSVCFGAGGINTEKIKDVSFRIYPFDRNEAESMISETKISKKLNEKEKKEILRVIMNVQNLINENPLISELDINPLMVDEEKVVIVDSRVVFEDS